MGMSIDLGVLGMFGMVLYFLPVAAIKIGIASVIVFSIAHAMKEGHKAALDNNSSLKFPSVDYFKDWIPALARMYLGTILILCTILCASSSNVVLDYEPDIQIIQKQNPQLLRVFLIR